LVGVISCVFTKLNKFVFGVDVIKTRIKNKLVEIGLKIEDLENSERSIYEVRLELLEEERLSKTIKEGKSKITKTKIPSKVRVRLWGRLNFKSPQVFEIELQPISN
jgi:hypothetical protein